MMGLSMANHHLFIILRIAQPTTSYAVTSQGALLDVLGEMLPRTAN